jgi:hypothetical protein
MEKPKTTTLEKQKAAAASLGSSKDAKPADAGSKPAKPKATKPVKAKKATKKAAKKRPAKKAAKKTAKRKTKPIGARIKVVKDTTKKAKPAAKKAAAKKAPTKKPAAKKAKSGQSAGAIALERAGLNTNETKVLEALRTGRKPLTLVEIAKAAFPRKTRAQGNSWVRNALRRLVRGNLVIKVERGTYKASPKGLGEDQGRPPVLAASPQKAAPPAKQEPAKEESPSPSPSPEVNASPSSASVEPKGSEGLPPHVSSGT